MFNSAYRGVDLQECLRLHAAGVRQPAPARPPPPHFPGSITKSELRLWQATLGVCLSTPGDPTLGRTILWCYEELGGMGKPVFASYLERRRRALVVGGTPRGVLHTFRSRHEQTGQLPPIVVFDLRRAADGGDTPWHAMECLKNGQIASGKYQSTTLTLPRPWVVALHNMPAPSVGAAISADRVVEVELRAFNAGLQDGVGALDDGQEPPSTVPELKACAAGVRAWAAEEAMAAIDRKRRQQHDPPAEGPSRQRARQLTPAPHGEGDAWPLGSCYSLQESSGASGLFEESDSEQTAESGDV